MNLKIIQKFYIGIISKENLANEINIVKRFFYNRFNINLNLSQEELAKEKI